MSAATDAVQQNTNLCFCDMQFVLINGSMFLFVQLSTIHDLHQAQISTRHRDLSQEWRSFKSESGV